MKILGSIKTHTMKIGLNPATVSINSTFPDEFGNVNITPEPFTGDNGSTVIFTEDNNFLIDKTVKIARIVETQEELEQSKGRIISLETIFNSWKRLSHGNLFTPVNVPKYPSIIGELNSWNYDSTNDVIYNNTDSLSALSFISTETYINYTMETRVWSTNPLSNKGADDFIYIVLAYTEIDGMQHTLTAVRKPFSRPNNVLNWGQGGIPRGTLLWGVMFNFMQNLSSTTYNEYIVAEASSEVDEIEGWGASSYGCNIKVERVNNIITVSTTKFTDPNTYVAELVIDLDSDPRLSIFKKPCRIGYGEISSPESKFTTFKFNKDINTLYDSRNGDIWNYNKISSEWDMNTSTTLYDELECGYIYGNNDTGKSFYINPDNTVTCIAGHSIGTGVNQIPNNELFPFVNSSSGSQELPNGLTIQWFTHEITNGKTIISLPNKLSTEIFFVYAEELSPSNSTSESYVFEYNKDESDIENITLEAYKINNTSVSQSTVNAKIFVIGV